jgi:hypothetical protein
MLKVAVVFVIFALPLIAVASYPAAKPNENLREEIQGDQNRLIPTTEHFTFAVDGETWFRALGTNDFYHGFGYWIQGRSEVRASSFFKLNARTIFYSGSSSNGYGNPIGFYNLIGLSGYLPPVLGFQVSARVVDIGRQSIGAGLLVQDREMNGVLIKAENPYASFRLLGDSTGSLVSADDVVNPELVLFQGWIGGGVGIWKSDKSDLGLRKNRGTYSYVFSSRPFGDIYRYAAEYGRREGAGAGLASVSAKKTLGKFGFQAKLEYRKYASNFGKDFIRQVQHQYISYDQYDKAYTNAMNVFVRDDDVEVYAAHLDLKYDFSHHWRIESLNEIGRFNFRRVADDHYYFYRAGVSYCPLVGRDDCLSLFSSNKVLNESYTRPPRETALTNVALFKRYSFLGLDAQFRF